MRIKSRMTDGSRRAWLEELCALYSMSARELMLRQATDPGRDLSHGAAWVARLAAHFGRLALRHVYTLEVPIDVSADWVEDCLQWRGRVLEGRYGHWCMEWDELPVDETCHEWPCGCAEMTDRLDAETSANTVTR
jgi:hypothetical protein